MHATQKLVRWLLVTCVLLASGVAHAKPRVAVLGLEVVHSTGADRHALRVAQILTAELRAQVLQQGNYDLAIDGSKDLLETKILSNCGDEGLQCMSAIGGELGVDMLLYGSLKRGERGYSVTLNLLDVSRRILRNSLRQHIALEDLGAVKRRRLANLLYSSLVAGVDSNTPEVEHIEIDDVKKTSVSQGDARLRIAGLAAIGAGAASIAIGIKFGLDARSASDCLNSYPAGCKQSFPGDQWTDEAVDLLEEGAALERRMYVAMSIGAGAVIAGGLLYLRGMKASSRSEPRRPLKVVPSASSDSVGVVLGGLF